jgi:hypothetical protein
LERKSIMSKKEEITDIACGNCVYYCDENKKPQCRKNAPTRRATAEGWNDGWPVTKGKEWCGEWTGLDEEGALVLFEDATVDSVGVGDGDEDEDEGEEDEG